MIAFAPKFNTAGKRDATGAFIPEAKDFINLHGGVLHLVNNRASEKGMREEVLNVLDRTSSKDGYFGVAFFCHGLSKRIQFGFRLQHLDTLASAIFCCCWNPLTVPLYACSTGRGALGGDGQFTDELRDALCRAGATRCNVDAHTTAGHATKNPFVRRFEGKGSPVGGVGGYYIVTPKSKLWGRWRLKLRNTDLRLKFPLMSVAEIHEEVMR